MIVLLVAMFWTMGEKLFTETIHAWQKVIVKPVDASVENWHQKKLQGIVVVVVSQKVDVSVKVSIVAMVPAVWTILTKNVLQSVQVIKNIAQLGKNVNEFAPTAVVLI